jgi:pimeloyl-ACP methyl ester carboxylesterase
MDFYRLAKRPFFGRYQRPWRWPDNVERTAWKRIEFETSRGAKLVGLYASSILADAKATIVCAHPMGVEAKGYFLKRGHAAMLLRNGYNVFLFDFNGFGESGSGSFDYPRDVLASGAAARALFPSKRLGVLGISFGASWAVCALANGETPFEAGVIESAFTTLDEYWRRYPIPHTTLKVLNVLLPSVADSLKPISKARDITRELLFVYGANDVVTPVEMGQRLMAASRSPEGARSFWIVPGAEHTKAMQAAPAPYETNVVGFFDRVFAAAT